MARDDRPQSDKAKSTTRGTTWRVLILLALLLAVAVGGYFTTQWFQAADSPSPMPPPMGELFRSWPTRSPDMVLVLTGQEHGYLQPCGCSRPQLGGLERRYNFISRMRERGWPVIPVDLGDIMYRKGIDDQALLKYEVAMKARKEMKYAAVGVGQTDTQPQLLDVLAHFTLQEPTSPPRVLAANLLDRDTKFPGEKGQSLVGAWTLARSGDKSPAVGVVAAIGPTVAGQIQAHDKDIRVGSTKDAVTLALNAMKADAAVRVLLYQGKPEEAESAASHFKGEFQVMLALSSQEEPAAEPVYLDGQGQRAAKHADAVTLIASVGHKSRHVGVVGLYRTGKPERPFDLHYQMASMGEEFETPEDQKDKHPIVGLMEGYTRQLRDEKFLAKQVKKPHPAQTANPTTLMEFVGSQRCQTCHKAEYEAWEKTKHAHAYEALVAAKHPSNRQYDNQCIVCHTVGFDYASGYTNAQQTPHLRGVGCESCHGPGNQHIREPKDAKFLAALSPWKANPGDRLPNQGVLKRADAICQKCHDTDNDPHFRFEQYWPKINHTGLAKME